MSLIKTRNPNPFLSESVVIFYKILRRIIISYIPPSSVLSTPLTQTQRCSPYGQKALHSKAFYLLWCVLTFPFSLVQHAYILLNYILYKVFLLVNFNEQY